MPDNKENTTVQEVEIDIDNILGTVSAANIMTPTDKKDEKPSFFARKAPTDISYLDKPIIQDKPTEKKLDKDGKEIETKVPVTGSEEDIQIKKEVESILNPVDEEEDIEKKGSTGRPSLSKDALLELANKLIEKKVIQPFDDEKTLDKYTIQDFEDLLEENMKAKEEKYRKEIPVEFFDSLPEELQYAAKYVADGGKDLKALFKVLAHKEEVRELDSSTEHGQEQIVRQYLQATNFGTEEDIQEEIDSWKDREELEAKANKFKPKLDAMNERFIASQLQKQESLRKQQEAQANDYMKNVYKVLEPSELNGVKLDKKVQSMLYAGLTQPNYPSISGRNTNLLGHLLEKYQYVEPRHDLIAEALYLLADPEGYRSKVREEGQKKATEKTVRALKTEEGKKISSAITQDDDNDIKRSQNGLKRPVKNFFAR